MTVFAVGDRRRRLLLEPSTTTRYVGFPFFMGQAYGTGNAQRTRWKEAV